MQEKKAPKKDLGGKSKARPSKQAPQQEPDLMDDSRLPASKVSMPVSVASLTPHGRSNPACCCVGLTSEAEAYTA